MLCEHMQNLCKKKNNVDLSKTLKRKKKKDEPLKFHKNEGKIHFFLPELLICCAAVSLPLWLIEVLHDIFSAQWKMQVERHHIVMLLCVQGFFVSLWSVALCPPSIENEKIPGAFHIVSSLECTYRLSSLNHLL